MIHRTDRFKGNHAFSSVGKRLALLQTHDTKQLFSVRYFVKKKKKGNSIFIENG